MSQREADLLEQGRLPAGRQGERGQLSQREADLLEQGRLPAGRQGERGQLSQREADLLEQGRLPAGRQGERGQLSQREADLLDQAQGRSVRVYPLVERDEQAAAALRRAGRFVEHVVEIRGEVRFPGFYPLIKGERLSSVLRRAGGFTQNAYLRGGTFTRVRVREEQQRRLQELIREEELSLLAQGATEAQVALSQEEVKGQQQAVDFRRDLLSRPWWARSRSPASCPWHPWPSNSLRGCLQGSFESGCPHRHPSHPSNLGQRKPPRSTRQPWHRDSRQRGLDSCLMQSYFPASSWSSPRFPSCHRHPSWMSSRFR